MTNTYRTSVCDRQRDLYEGKTQLQDALEGLNISVAITNYKIPNEDAFFTLVDGKIKEENPGLFVVILDEIARRGGFSWRNSFAAIDPLDSTIQVGKSWTDLLEWEVDSFDIAADYWARSVDRMSRGISFPMGWSDGSIILVLSEESTDKFNLWSFLLPFESNVWIAMAGAIFFSGLMYFFLERLNSSSDKRHLAEKPVTAIFLAAITFTGHFEYRPNTNAARLLSFSWTFWTLIMASAYTANMASFLVQRRAAVTSVNNIDDAVRQAVPVCVQRGAIIDELLSKTNPDLILVRKETEKDVFDGLKQNWYGGNGGCGLVLTNLGTFELYQSQKSSNADCSLASERHVILSLPAGFATAMDSGIMCTSLISYVMDYHLQQMKSDGFIDRAWQDHITRISTIKCGASEPSLVENVSLTLKDMGGIFITHALMTMLALSLAILQYLYAKFRVPGSTRQSNALVSSQQSNVTSSVSTLWVGGSNPQRKRSGTRHTEDAAKPEDSSLPIGLVQSDAANSAVVSDGDVHQ